MTAIRSSRAAKACRIPGDESVEPSLTQMISRPGMSWASALSRQPGRYFSTLYTGMMMDRTGSMGTPCLQGVSFVSPFYLSCRCRFWRSKQITAKGRRTPSCRSRVSPRHYRRWFCRCAIFEDSFVAITSNLEAVLASSNISARPLLRFFSLSENKGVRKRSGDRALNAIFTLVTLAIGR